VGGSRRCWRRGRVVGKCNTLEDHLLVEVWGAKSCLTEAIYERSKWFTLFLPNAQEGDCGSLVWTLPTKWMENMWDRASKLSME